MISSRFQSFGNVKWNTLTLSGFSSFPAIFIYVMPQSLGTYNLLTTWSNNGEFGNVLNIFVVFNLPEK